MIDTTKCVCKPKLPFELTQRIKPSKINIADMGFEEAVLETRSWGVDNGETVCIPDQYEATFRAWCVKQPGYIPEIGVEVYRSW